MFILFCCCTSLFAGADGWQAGQLIKAEELASALARPEGTRPVILHVGVQVLFRNGHIPGSKYVGAGWTAEGIRNLRAEVTKLPRTTAIVLYCGCCPWDDCPNLHPAAEALKNLKFSNVKVLYLPSNFQQDWTAKGYPTVKSELP